MSLIGKEFIGKIVPGFDPKIKGRYRVHIAELMPHQAEDIGIWCKNGIHTGRLTGSDSGSYGSYYPLHPGTWVKVKFSEDNLNSGYISRITSDIKEMADSGNCFDFGPNTTPEDRDDKYIILKTPKFNNIIYINESTSEKSNTLYIIFNGRRSFIKVDEEGIKIQTNDNQFVKIKTDDKKQVIGNQSEKVTGNSVKQVEGEMKLKISGDFVIENDGKTSISSNGGKLCLYSNKEIEIQAPRIRIGKSLTLSGVSKHISGDDVEDIPDLD